MIDSDGCVEKVGGSWALEVRTEGIRKVLDKLMRFKKVAMPNKSEQVGRLIDKIAATRDHLQQIQICAASDPQNSELIKEEMIAIVKLKHWLRVEEKDAQ